MPHSHALFPRWLAKPAVWRRRLLCAHRRTLRCGCGSLRRIDAPGGRRVAPPPDVAPNVALWLAKSSTRYRIERAASESQLLAPATFESIVGNACQTVYSIPNRSRARDRRGSGRVRVRSAVQASRDTRVRLDLPLASRTGGVGWAQPVPRGRAERAVPVRFLLVLPAPVRLHGAADGATARGLVIGDYCRSSRAVLAFAISRENFARLPIFLSAQFMMGAAAGSAPRSCSRPSSPGQRCNGSSS